MLLVFATGAAPRASLPDIEDEVMCVECNTALNVSTSTVADQERAFIRRQIALGKDKQQVKAALVAEYGPGVLARPAVERLRPRRLAGPDPAGGAGDRRRRVRRAPLAPRGRRPSPPPREPLADEDARRLDAELAAYDRR